MFSGNPAGVCLLEEWPEDAVLQSIAAENNLSETAFLVKSGKTYELKWFTPKMQVDLCGHATLASAFVIFKYVDPSSDRVSFATKSGLLTVVRTGDMLAMDFPSRPATVCPAPDLMTEAFGSRPVEIRLSVRDYLAIFETEDQVRRLQPDMQGLCKLDSLGIIVTAPGIHIPTFA